MLHRLGIRQKLGLLLAIPLSAIIVVLVPLAADRINEARAAAVTERTALVARAVGSLLQDLQQERILAFAYLGSPEMARDALVSQNARVLDTLARLRGQSLTAPYVDKFVPTLDTLAGIRSQIVSRTVDANTVYDVYRSVDEAIINALSLTDSPDADPTGQTRLAALDALIRSSEEAGTACALLIASVGDRVVSLGRLPGAMTADQQHLQRFRELSTREQTALVDAVDFAQSDQRIHQLADTLTTEPMVGQRLTPLLSETLSAALTYTSLRHLAQDRVAREIANDAQRHADTSRITAFGVVGGAIAVFSSAVGLGIVVSQSIAVPLRRLSRAAGTVADLARSELVRVADSDTPDPAPPQLAAIEAAGADEVSDLANSLNRVQATAALLLERQVVARRNVSVMFANIARRTQNLVGRQLALIDDLERNERDPELLARLYRLDHVATRLRRSADSLLVVSGTIDQTMSGVPTLLFDVIRSAMSEIEGFRSIKLGDICDVAISAAVAGDLRLLLAELLENAANFSPPGSSVDVTATLNESCVISVIDHGVGLSPARMDEENRRLVERERLDVAPTTVLGLFVVGRLTRRHGMTARLTPTQGRGVTAQVEIPAYLLADASGVTKQMMSAGAARLPAEFAKQLAAPPALPPANSAPFAWFRSARPGAGGDPGLPTAPGIGGSPGASPPRPAAPQLPRPAVGPLPPPRGTPPPAPAGVPPLPRRPESAPSHGSSAPFMAPTTAGHRLSTPAMGQFMPPEPVRTEPPLTAAGLARRIPGTNLDDLVRNGVGAEEPTLRVTRDPEAERGALNDYLAGLARSVDDASHSPAYLSQPSTSERQP